ncbi:hypothetical protein SUGI_1183200 [Cryptomeria japonica]|nr:hypothetical protein SUGI_1183200 [Cryptomeria japonica]
MLATLKGSHISLAREPTKTERAKFHNRRLQKKEEVSGEMIIVLAITARHTEKWLMLFHFCPIIGEHYSVQGDAWKQEMRFILQI